MEIRAGQKVKVFSKESPRFSQPHSRVTKVNATAGFVLDDNESSYLL